MSGNSSFLVVANRLPVDRITGRDGKEVWRRSPGGLVTALEPVMATKDGAWIGWAGLTEVTPDPFKAEDGTMLHPVGLSEDEVNRYYEGYSNASLWPLYHDRVAAPEFHRSWWDAYQRVNQRFAEATAAAAGKGATVWVQDYQLQLVPAMLRKLRPDLRIGFFLHIPFPPVELFIQMPWRKEIVEGLLGADLIGFQSHGGASNFLQLTRRLLGLSPGRRSVKTTDADGTVREVTAESFPISIDVKAMETAAADGDVIARTAQIRSDLGDPDTVLLGVDRLDYTKGIGIRIQAFRELIEDGRIDGRNTTLVQVATPSRERVEHYRALRSEIEQAVSRINGDFGRVGKPVVHYLHQSYNRKELASLYLAGDVMLVTPLRDGMNLVAKEYVATRTDHGGAVLLSEFTGAAAEMKQAFLVNPYDMDQVKDQLVTAIEAEPADKARRMRAMRRQISTHDVAHWAKSFLTELGVPS